MGQSDIFVKDLVSGVTTRVSTDSAAVQGNGGSCLPRASAATGGTWRFGAPPATWSPATPMGQSDIFVKDLVSGVTTRVSTDSAAVQGNSDSDDPSISGDGRYVAFQSYASNLVSGDTNGTSDIFVKDLVSGVTTRVSTDSSAVQGNSDSYAPSISGDGRYVAFQSYASNLVSGDTNGAYDIFVKDLVSGVTTRVSTDSSAVQGNGDSYDPSISGDGRYVAFQSDASNLVSGDTNGMSGHLRQGPGLGGHHAGEHRQRGSPGQWRFLRPEHQRRRAVRGVSELRQQPGLRRHQWVMRTSSSRTWSRGSPRG